MKNRFRLWGAATLIAVALCRGSVVHAEDLADKIERLETELQEMKRELQRQKDVQAQQAREAAERAAKEAENRRVKEAQQQAGKGEEASAEAQAPGYPKVLDRVQVGGYGSTRFEASDLDNQKNSFVLRRFVLTTDANIAPRLRSYFELEFERFHQLEVQKTAAPEGGGLAAGQEIEASNNSEIALEQAWLQFDAQDWLGLRAGGVLVPLGRFNVNHDDNRWNLPRRSLVDRGVPVLPSTSAWDELGAGVVGSVPVGDQAQVSYQGYVMNGVALDYNITQITKSGNSTPAEVGYEVELEPQAGGFAQDVKDSKAVGGRTVFSPALGHELGLSGYIGRYTPSYLANEDLWALSADGLTGYGPFELEGEFVFTRFDGTQNVARSLASTAGNQSANTGNPALNTQVDFELANLAKNRYGYWLEGRYRFWPTALNQTVLGKPFANPQFLIVFRPEQAWLDQLVEEASFSGGQLTSFDTANRRVDRFTIGFAYRPVPAVVFQLAYEYTQTNHGQSLAGVTNYLPAGPHEDSVNTFMVGSAFGF